MTRSRAWFALFAWRVPRQRWPVSAKPMAASIVSVSRTSPMRITSGACRSVYFRALAIGEGIEPDLSLGYDTLLVMVHEFYRVLYGDDVPFLIFVPVIDHRSEGRRFARSGRTHNEHQAAFGHNDIFKDLGQSKVVDRLYLYLNLPDDDPDVAHLPENTYPEPSEVGIEEGQAHLKLFFESPLLPLVHNTVSHFLGVFSREDFHAPRHNVPQCPLS